MDNTITLTAISRLLLLLIMHDHIPVHLSVLSLDLLLQHSVCMYVDANGTGHSMLSTKVVFDLNIVRITLQPKLQLQGCWPDEHFWAKSIC